MYAYYLSGGFDSLPDTEVNQNPDGHQTQHELPVHPSGFIQTRGDVQYLVPAHRERDRTFISIQQQSESRSVFSSHSGSSWIKTRAIIA